MNALGKRYSFAIPTENGFKSILRKISEFIKSKHDVIILLITDYEVKEKAVSAAPLSSNVDISDSLYSIDLGCGNATLIGNTRVFIEVSATESD